MLLHYCIGICLFTIDATERNRLAWFASGNKNKALIAYHDFLVSTLSLQYFSGIMWRRSVGKAPGVGEKFYITYGLQVDRITL